MTSDGSSGKFQAAMALLWDAPKPGTRGPKPSRSLDDVLDAAIGLADREGLEAVSMQRLAQELKFTKMAVYRYVPGRAELIALMADRALGVPPELDTGEGWRPQIEAWSLAVFDVFLQHPWGLQATTGPRPIGPNEAEWTERALAILASTGLNGADRFDVLAVAVGHLRSMAQQIAAWNGRIDSLESDMANAYSLMLRGREARFPEFSRTVADAFDPVQSTNGLTFGLNCIFDGVEAGLARRKRSAAKRRG